MDRYPGYQSMLTRVEHMKMQVKAQLAPEQSNLVDDLVAFVLDQANECSNVAIVDATTDTAQDHLLPGSNEPVARAFADDTRIDASEHANTVNPQMDHQHEAASGSISNEQTVSPPSLPSVTQSSIPASIEVKVEDESNGHSVQLCEWIKKEDEDDDYEAQLFHCCDCGGEGCEECKVKLEIKEEFDESDETEQMEDCVKQEIKEELEDGEMMNIKEEEEEDGEVEGERPNKIQRMDLMVGDVSVGSPSSSLNVTSINVEYVDEQVATSSTSSTTIQDLTQPSQPFTSPLPTPIVTPTQSPSSSAHHVNETLRDEPLSDEPMMDNVGLLVDVGAEEIDREQVDEDNSTLSPVHTDQDDEEVDDNTNDDEDEGDETIEPREDTNAGDGQQVLAENFVKRIETDELGNRFECDYRGCGKRMKHRSNMNQHIRAHTGEKRFKCSVAGCERAFVQNSQLKVHLNAHSGTRSFVCSRPGCEARFAKKSHLTVHLRTHTGERPYECDQCDATFAQSSHLVAHLRTHTGSRPFVCTWPECGQAFATSSFLKEHSFVHSNERQFVCDAPDCNKAYKHKRTLRQHQKDQHNLP